MFRMICIASVLGLFLASVAFADLPLPKDLKYVDPRVRFEGIDNVADQVFYLRFLTFASAPGSTPYTLKEVKDAKPFNLNAQRRLTNMSLLAIERKDFDKRAKDDPSLKWLSDKTDGVKSASLQAPSTVGKISEKEVPVTTYRVALKDGKLTAEMVKDAKRGDAAPIGLMPLWVFGIVSALSIACLGVWAARRRHATPQAAIKKV